jgi:hypothetical protein
LKPSVGRIVHYVSFGTPAGEYGRECRAAIITEVSKEHTSSAGEMVPKASLCVLNPAGQFFNRDVHYGAGRPDGADGTTLCDGLDYAGGSWHWPARVE